MSKNKEITSKSQFFNAFFSHLKTVLILFFIFYFALLSLWTVNILNKVLAVLVLVIYIFAMASCGNLTAEYDLKSYSKTTPFWYKGLLMGISIIVSNFIAFCTLKLVWAVAPQTNLATVIANILFCVWTIPYNSFLKLSGSDITVLGHVLMYTVPIISTGFGYFSGYKKWNILEKLNKLTFEKKQ